MTTSRRPLRGASDRETHRRCVSSPLLLGVADISAALPLVPNDSRSLYSGHGSGPRCSRAHRRIDSGVYLFVPCKLHSIFSVLLRYLNKLMQLTKLVGRVAELSPHTPKYESELKLRITILSHRS
jgi:hypothetical protein